MAGVGDCEDENNCCCVGAVFLLNNRLGWGIVKSRVIAAVRGQNFV